MRRISPKRHRHGTVPREINHRVAGTLNSPEHNQSFKFTTGASTRSRPKCHSCIPARDCRGWSTQHDLPTRLRHDSAPPSCRHAQGGGGVSVRREAGLVSAGFCYVTSPGTFPPPPCGARVQLALAHVAHFLHVSALPGNPTLKGLSPLSLRHVSRWSNWMPPGFENQVAPEPPEPGKVARRILGSTAVCPRHYAELMRVRSSIVR